MIKIKQRRLCTGHVVDYVVDNVQEILDAIVNDNDNYQHIESIDLGALEEIFDTTQEDESIELEYILKKIKKAKEEKALIIDSDFNVVVDAEDIKNGGIATASYVYILS